MSQSCALFLTRFLLHLSSQYNTYCTNTEKDCHHGLNTIIYRNALEKSLLKFALEDLNEHGRLLVLKDHLLSLVDRS